MEQPPEVFLRELQARPRPAGNPWLRSRQPRRNHMEGYLHAIKQGSSGLVTFYAAG
jgi:hypothetical protein